MKFRILILSLAALVATQAQSTTIVAKVGDIEISGAQLQEALAGLDAAQEATLVKDPAALGQYVRALLVQRLVLKQALEQKWDQQPAVISKLVRARESTLAESFLQNASAPESAYPSEAELAAAYESNKAALLIPRSYQIAQIYIAADKAKLDAAVQQLKTKDADFAAIARTTSEEPASAGRGGEIGWLTEDQIQPEIRAKLPKLTLGTISDPIELNDGWHILKVLDIGEARTPTLIEIRENLTASLRAERARLKRQEFIAGLLKPHPPAINEIELAKILSAP
jgi:peptidylprolyl isomerase